ncbi:MAG: alpha/beta hydrolase fold domain-containing protein, partial [Brooklawnia sp.]
PATWPDHDPQTSPFDSVRQFGTGLRLTAREVQDYMTLYEPSPEARADPRIAPLLADDLSGQPTTLVVTAEFDLLRDEGEAYGQALEAAGNAVRIERIDGAYHGFLTLPRFAAPVVRLHGLINDFLGSAPEVARP